MHTYCPVKPPSAYSLNKYELGEADLSIQVYAILEQSCISRSSALDGFIFPQRAIEVPTGPVVDPVFNMSLEGPTLHTDGVVEDVQHCNHTKELEVGEEETVPKLDISQLSSLHTGSHHIKDHLLFRIADCVGEC